MRTLRFGAGYLCWKRLHSQHVEIGPNDDGWSEYDETETLLEQFIFEQKNLRYTYDFGDDWIHKITFEKEDPEYSGRNPLLLKVKGNNYEEDAGGVWWGDTPENSRPLDEEKAKEKLKKMDFPRRDDLAASLADLNILQAKLQDAFKKVEDSFGQNPESTGAEQSQKAHEISPGAEKTDAWKKFTDRAGAKTLKYVKGSRTEYAAIKNISLWDIRMADGAAFENTPALWMYEFPAKIQEQMDNAMSASLRDADELAAYKKREHIRSEEFIYLLARSYTASCEFDKARSLADELPGSSKRENFPVC